LEHRSNWLQLNSNYQVSAPNLCQGSRSRENRVFADKEVCPALILRSLMMMFLFASGTAAQNVTTQHNDIARTGAYTTETVLTPSNVNTNTFGKVFYYVVDGYVYAQPLYMANITMGAGTPQPGTTHNVVFVATEHDSVYAFDADGNLGANSKPLWQITLLDAAHGAAAGATTVPSSDLSTTDLIPEVGITGTPVIDPATNTMYVVGKTKESGTYIQRLHALSITDGTEKFGGPVVLSASVPGNGNGSSAGTLKFDPKWTHQRTGLLMLNGIIYFGFGAHQDTGPYHGWILAYNAATLQQTGAWCSTPNGLGGGIWLGGSGLAAVVSDPVGHPYGRLYAAMGNGLYDATAPNYSNVMDYGDSIIKLDLANGAPTMISGGTTVGDDFTPHDQASLSGADKDQGSGGALILPDSFSGGQHLLAQVGKSGRIYILDQNNLGGYNPANTSDPQAKAFLSGEVYGMPAFWNGHLYAWSGNDHLKAFSFANGTLSANPTSTSVEGFQFPGSTPTISANGTTNGIVWNVRTDAFGAPGPEILYAHDAANVSRLLYSSGQNASRDNPGNAVKFAVPTAANGRVYVGAEYQLSVYGLLNGATQAAEPVINPAGQLFHPSIQVTITDSSPNAQIFYTTDGSTPTTASTVYTGPFNISSTQTVKAIADGAGYLASLIASETYTLINQVPMPVFSLPPGDFSSAQSVAITDAWSGSTIYYSTDGTVPTLSSNVYTGPVTISTTSTLKAIATAPNLSNSRVASGLYTIVQNPSSSINFGGGFTSGGMLFVGPAKLNGTHLRVTDGGSGEAAAAWYSTQVNVQGFSTDFQFQQTPGTNPVGDGLTFTIQGTATTAVGPSGGGLGYGASLPGGTPGIPKSVAVKFDLFSNASEGNNSTGLYLNGASPTKPAITLGGGVNLQSGDVFAVHIAYDGTTLTMTITDTVNNSQTFTTSWPVDIPTTVGGNTAFVGFTGGTGHYTVVQDIMSWTYVSTATGGQQTAATPVISPATGTFTSPQTVTITDATSGSSVFYTLDGSQPTTSSTPYTASFTVNGTTTVRAIATAPSFLQSATTTSVITINQQSQTSAPLISPVTGTYSSPQTVNITDATSGSTIFYTLDGSQPTTSSTQYTSAFTVSTTTTVKAIATAPNFTPSATSTSVITINQQSPAATPVISPATGTFTSSQTVTITDATTGSTIYYTLDGSQPTTASTQYTASFTVSATTTVKAIATAPNFTQSATASSVITINQASPAATPVISPATGTFTSSQTVNITDATSGSTIYYTLDGSQPTTASTQYTSSFTVSATTTVKAIATASGFTQSNTATSVITIQSGSTSINFASGFTATGLASNGRTTLNGTRLRLTNGGQSEASSAWFTTPVNVQSFTTDFSFQLINPNADGMTFTLQNAGTTALGPSGGGLGYGAGLPGGTPGIPTSVAVKFDLFQNSHEGNNSTGLYTNGASPTSPATTLGGGINLHSGDIFKVHMTYDGTTLTMTITDTVTNATFTTSWPINIPATVGANTALVGFTAGTGGQTATQEIISWTYGS
jgi:hypothetical protein